MGEIAGRDGLRISLAILYDTLQKFLKSYHCELVG